MSDLPNNPDPTRRSARALPSPQPEPAATERQASQAAGAGASSFNASLLEAVRESSRLTQDSFRELTREVRGIHKDLSEHIKSLQAQVKYHQLKQSKWMKFEEEFFREGTKLIARSKGLLDKFPADSPIYRSDFGAASTPSTGKARDQNGRFTSGDKKDDTSSEKPQGSILAGTDEDWNDLKKFAGLWKTRFKTFADYAQTPIKLTDTIPAYILGFVSKSIADRKAAEAKKEADAKKAAGDAKAEQKAAEDKAAEAAEDAARWDELLDKYFTRLKETLDEKWPDKETEASPEEGAPEEPYAEAHAEPVLLGSSSLDSLLLPEGTGQAALPSANTPFALPAPADYLEGFSWEDMGSVPFPRDELLVKAAEALPPALRSTSEKSSYVFGGQPALLGAPGENLFSSQAPSEGGPFSGPSPDEAAADALDDSGDLLDYYFANQRLFFTDPASSPVGKWVMDLLGASDDKDGAKVKNPKLDLPDWLKTWAFGLLAEVGIFLLELLPVALALAAGILLLSVGGLLVLGSIAVAILAIAAVVAFLGFVLGISLMRTLGIANDLLAGLVEAFLGFLKDPGTFADKLLTGLGKGIAGLLTGVSEGLGAAFKNIPILNTLADTVGAIGKDVSSISRAVSGVVVEALQGVKGAVGAVSGLTQALIALIGGSVLGTIFQVRAVIAGGFAWLMAGGIFDKGGAAAAYDTAYSTSMGADVSMLREVGGIVSSPEGSKLVNAMANNIVNRLDPKTQAAVNQTSAANEAYARSHGGYGSQTNTVNIQHVSAFSTIPIQGAF